MGQQVTALGYAPVCPYLVNGFLVSSGRAYFPGKLHRYVYGEGFRKEGHLAGSGKRLEPRYHRHCDSCLAASVHVVIEHAVVEKHLGDDIVGAGIHLLFQEPRNAFQDIRPHRC